MQRFAPFATGLRNSMALAVLPATPDAKEGRVLQGENSIDYRDPKNPPEELNLLQRGRHYGWPYCVGRRQAAQGYEGRYDCARTEAPLALWPAHAAPLQMLMQGGKAARRRRHHRHPPPGRQLPGRGPVHGQKIHARRGFAYEVGRAGIGQPDMMQAQEVGVAGPFAPLGFDGVTRVKSFHLKLPS